jgi:hypothetical protein
LKVFFVLVLVLTMVEIVEAVAVKALCCLCARKTKQAALQSQITTSRDPKLTAGLADLRMTAGKQPDLDGHN